MTETATDSPATTPEDVLGARLATLASARGSRRDAILLRVSIAGMVLGVGVAIAAYFVSHLTSDPLVQNDAVVMATAATAFTIMSTGVFVVVAITGFLRFWLARLIYTLGPVPSSHEGSR